MRIAERDQQQARVDNAAGVLPVAEDDDELSSLTFRRRRQRDCQRVEEGRATGSGECGKEPAGVDAAVGEVRDALDARVERDELQPFPSRKRVLNRSMDWRSRSRSPPLTLLLTSSTTVTSIGNRLS